MWYGYIWEAGTGRRLSRPGRPRAPLRRPTAGAAGCCSRRRRSRLDDFEPDDGSGRRRRGRRPRGKPEGQVGPRGCRWLWFRLGRRGTRWARLCGSCCARRSRGPRADPRDGRHPEGAGTDPPEPRSPRCSCGAPPTGRCEPELSWWTRSPKRQVVRSPHSLSLPQLQSPSPASPPSPAPPLPSLVSPLSLPAAAQPVYESASRPGDPARRACVAGGGRGKSSVLAPCPSPPL